MIKGQQHNSVSEMVRSTVGDGRFADDFDRRMVGRRLVKTLAILRTFAGLTQQQLAEKLGCTQSKVSKIESGRDAGLRFGEVEAYAKACGYGLHIRFQRSGPTIVGQVKNHAFEIKRLLDRLVELAEDDDCVVKAVASFLNEAALNLTKLVQKATESLPALPEEDPADSIRIEGDGAEKLEETGENEPSREEEVANKELVGA